MDHSTYSDAYLRSVLRRVRTIAMVGASPNWNRPSYFAMKYLQTKGFRVIPVNPAAFGVLDVSIRILAGDADRLTPPPGAEELARRLPNATFHLVERSGHQIMLEQPDATNRALFDLIAASQ